MTSQAAFRSNEVASGGNLAFANSRSRAPGVHVQVRIPFHQKPLLRLSLHRGRLNGRSLLPHQISSRLYHMPKLLSDHRADRVLLFCRWIPSLLLKTTRSAILRRPRSILRAFKAIAARRSDPPIRPTQICRVATPTLSLRFRLRKTPRRASSCIPTSRTRCLQPKSSKKSG